MFVFSSVMQPPRFDDREAAERVAAPGISVGLVWTNFGGEVQFVEATAMRGKGELHLTGQLGDVIKESAQIALTWVIYFSRLLYSFLFLPFVEVQPLLLVPGHLSLLFELFLIPCSCILESSNQYL